MIKIAVCMKDVMESEQLQKLLSEYFRKKGIVFFSAVFQTEEDLLKSATHQFHVVFLDVDFRGKENGINVAKALRKKLYYGDIVFIAGDTTSAYLAFTVNALQYLMMPLERRELYRTLEMITMRKDIRENQVIALNRGQKYFQISYDKILYFETVDRKIKVHTINKEYIVDNKINKLESMLAQYSFFRVHKSYLVNLAYVKEYDQNIVTMRNDDEVYLSRLKYKEFKENFLLYIKDKNEKYNVNIN